MDVAALFAEHHAPLFRYLSRLTGEPDAAADAAQEAFVRLMEKPPAPTHMKAWLFKVGTNLVREHARTSGRRQRLVSGAEERAPMGDAPARPDVALETAQKRKRVQSAL